jgi:predicted acyltransferase
MNSASSAEATPSDVGTLSPQSKQQSLKARRLTSLDVFRGATMFFLVMGGTNLIDAMQDPALSGTIWDVVSTQFTHHPWNGLRFWDLVQPFFMFIVGVAMPFSFGRRWERGHTWMRTFRKALSRSFLLFLFGVGLHCIYAGELVFELWNVLTQLSFTYLVAFLIMRKSIRIQLSFSFALIVLTYLAYHLWPVEGFNQPYTPDQNFGSHIDMLLMGKLSGGHWVTVNAVPTAAHTIWGVLAGQIIRSERTDLKKVQIIAIAGLIGIVVGYLLDPIDPIIKRICTPSFVIVSGGWSLLVLAGLYYIIDVKNYDRGTLFFIVFGMNPLFIYLFGNTGGEAWFQNIVSIFTNGFFGWLGPELVPILTAVIVLALEWYVVHWMYKNDIFIKI